MTPEDLRGRKWIYHTQVGIFSLSMPKLDLKDVLLREWESWNVLQTFLIAKLLQPFAVVYVLWVPRPCRFLLADYASELSK